MLVVKKGNPLYRGCHKWNKSYHFSIVGKYQTIKLLIFESGERTPKYTIEMDESFRVGDIFACEISGVGLDRCFYCYEADGVLLIDPCARTITDCGEFGIEDANAFHVSRIVTSKYDWGEDAPLKIPFSDSIIYKLNVRGFTKSRTSGVKHKGTFQGIIEKIPYLKSLGITTLELMPAYEFDEMNRFPQLQEQTMSMYAGEPMGAMKSMGGQAHMHSQGSLRSGINYWGYTKGFYYAPKASFSATAKVKQDYTIEMKEMIKKLHENGIEVIMEMFFANEDPSMILDCMRFWIMEYHLDGIHLYGPEEALKVAAKDPILSHTKLLTVYWDGECFPEKHMANYNAGFQNMARQFLKGDENKLAAFVEAIKSNPDQSANINYITNHNGFTLTDLVSYDRKHNDANHENNRDGEDFNYSWNCGIEGKSRKKKVMELRRKQIRNGFMMLLLAQGTPLLLAGDEFENTQGGNNNPYCIDGETTWLNWKTSKEACALQDFVRKLIAFRKEHKILHMDRQLYAYDQLSCGFPDVSYHGSSAWFHAMENYNRHVGVMYCQSYARNENRNGNETEDIELIYVAYNMHWESHELALPKTGDLGTWEVVISSSEKSEDVQVMGNRMIVIASRCIAVLRGIVSKSNSKKDYETSKGKRRKPAEVQLRKVKDEY